MDYLGKVKELKKLTFKNHFLTFILMFSDPITNIQIPKGDKVTVLGGTGNGQYVIEYKDCRLDVSLHCFRLEQQQQQSEFVSNIALCI